MPDSKPTTPTPVVDENTKSIERAKECYGMSKTWAFFEALMFNNGDYRTPQGRLQIKDSCFNDIAAPTVRAGVSKSEAEQVRSTSRRR